MHRLSVNSRDNSAAFRLSLENRFAQERPNENRRFLVSYIEPNQTVPGVSPGFAIKVAIQAEKGTSRKAMEYNEKVFVTRPCHCNIHTHRAEPPPPLTQQE